MTFQLTLRDKIRIKKKENRKEEREKEKKRKTRNRALNVFYVHKQKYLKPVKSVKSVIPVKPKILPGLRLSIKWQP